MFQGRSSALSSRPGISRQLQHRRLLLDSPRLVLLSGGLGTDYMGWLSGRGHPAERRLVSADRARLGSLAVHAFTWPPRLRPSMRRGADRCLRTGDPSARCTFWVSVFAGVAWFFAAGFYANAEHVDIARGYAWIPWAMLAVSSRWRWTSWWQAPLAAVVLWQAATAMYPVKSSPWAMWPWFGSAIGNGWTDPGCWEYLAPLPSPVCRCRPERSTTTAVLPAWGRRHPTPGDDSRFRPSLVGTLLYGFGSPDLPNYIGMRSFFLPATVLALVAGLRSQPGRQAGLALVLPALALGMPFLPWFVASQSLPGPLTEPVRDERLQGVLLLGMVLVAAAGMNRLVTHPPELRNSADAARLGVSIASAAIMMAVGVLGPFPLVEWAPEWFLLILAMALAAAAGRGLPRRAVVGTLLLLTLLSGAMWTQGISFLWQVPRLDLERTTYGATLNELIAQQRPTNAIQRPARTALPEGYTSTTLRANARNAAYYSDRLAVGGTPTSGASARSASLRRPFSIPS